MGIFSRLKRIAIGEKRDPEDPRIFHKLALMAFLAWVGLGSDGLTSSCYGPAEVFMSLDGHNHLGLIVALASVLTIVIISSSYSQIIELFPSGGGGYLVSTKLLNPYVGMVSGVALVIDYVLTITVSIASGTEALFSFLPPAWFEYRLFFMLFVVLVLMVLNMRGVKESVKPLIPIFIIFVVTHVFIVLYAVALHFLELPQVFSETAVDFSRTSSDIGIFMTLWLIMHAYSMGAGTYTGIEAVANGMPILQEPKVHTAKRTMLYMSASLSFMVFGLILSYIVFNTQVVDGKTMNAVLFETATSTWDPTFSAIFIVVTLLSEALLLYVAAQTGFLDGPRVLSNMALDRWVPTRFALLSDRLVTQKGIVLMAMAAFVMMIVSDGSVKFLVVLYSINVFLDFCLSQLGMVRHWIQVRKEDKKWFKKIIINGIGFSLSFGILISVIVVKFFEGGWITLAITGAVICVVLYIKREYNKAGKMIRKLDSLLDEGLISLQMEMPVFENERPQYDRNGRTAVLLVNGFSGIGIHSMLSIFRYFGDNFKNFVVMQIGIIDAGNFHGPEHIEKLKVKISTDTQKYIDFLTARGYYSEAFTGTGMDVEQEILKLVPEIRARFPRSMFFGGQVVFPEDTFITRLLHNYTVFSLQRKLYTRGIEFVILPIKMNN